MLCCFGSRQLPVEEWSPIRIDSNRAAARLAQMLRFETVSYQDASRLDSLAEELSGMGFNLWASELAAVAIRE